MYEEGTLQSFFHSEKSPWWTISTSKELCRGRLLKAFVPHTDLIPNVLVAESRAEPTVHDRVNYRIENFSIANPPRNPKLPVAALQNFPGERRFVYRAKKRPVLVISRVDGMCQGICGRERNQSGRPTRQCWLLHITGLS